jgi:oligopeptide/dipeptide ABC transporter ATP-binding protein
MCEPILLVQGLSKTFARPPALFERIQGVRSAPIRPALFDVSVTLLPAEILGIVGESGSGKSTLARCIALLTTPDAGSVIFEGVDLTRLRGDALRRRRRRIQVVYQDPYSSLNPRLSVGGALSEVLRVHRLVERDRVDDRVAELLEQVGMSRSTRNRYPADFSGGQRQRICIARALAAVPSVLIADEAASALDVSVQAQIVNLLLDLRARLGLGMIFISHNLHLVHHVAARIAVMFGGRIVESLPADVPLEDAVHPYTRALLTAMPRLDSPEMMIKPPSADLAVALPVDGCPFRERCPLAHDLCAIADAALLPFGPGHLVACHALTPGQVESDSGLGLEAAPTYGGGARN